MVFELLPTSKHLNYISREDHFKDMVNSEERIDMIRYGGEWGMIWYILRTYRLYHTPVSPKHYYRKYTRSAHELFLSDPRVTSVLFFQEVDPFQKTNSSFSGQRSVIININTTAIDCLWFVTLQTSRSLRALPCCAVSLAGVSRHRRSRLSPAFKRCRLPRGTGRRSRLSADIGRESWYIILHHE